MATSEQYEEALRKAERSGFKSLGRIEQDLVKRLRNQNGATGNRARQLKDVD